MHNCESLDPLVTPFVDGELSESDRRAVEDHLRNCPPCYSRIAAERAVHDLLHARKAGLCRGAAPESLHRKCFELGRGALAADTAAAARQQLDAMRGSSQPITRTAADRISSGARPQASGPRLPAADSAFKSRLPTALAPYALAASLFVVVGGAFVYQATDKSARVMAAELVADHTKCFALNSALGTHQTAAVVEQSMAVSFDWRVHLPDHPANAGLELVGARPCLYGEGKIAHIMYTHEGHPVSVFMLPQTARPQELVEVLGHEASIWCANNRTFVLVAREPRADVERIASYVRASLH